MMKSLKYLLLVSVLCISCNKNDDTDENCNFLLNIAVDRNIPLSLNQELQFSQLPKIFSNEGNGGIVVMKTLGDTYVAWDIADPNHQYSSCSIMSIEGTVLTCNCNDENKYDINTGYPLTENLACGLKGYRVEQSGNNLYISN